VAAANERNGVRIRHVMSNLVETAASSKYFYSCCEPVSIMYRAVKKDKYLQVA
jgi:hypothetical protein